MKRMHRMLLVLTLIALPIVMLATRSAAAQPDQFTVGSLHVEVHGDHGRPLILIPGLGSGGWVWQGTVKHFQGSHKIFVLTLAGFDATTPPADKTDLMGQAEASLAKLITERAIHDPVLVGHSLGGTLAIAFAERHSDLLSGVVAVDGLPIFPGMERISAKQRQARAEMLQARIGQATPEQFAAQQLRYMQTQGVLDPAAAKKYAALQARSNPQTVARYLYADLTTDLRPGLDKITVPLLEVSPYNAPDFKKAAAAGVMPMLSEEQKTAYYAKLLHGVPDLQVKSIAPARHFVMLDQPARFHAMLDAFLADLPVPNLQGAAHDN